MKTRGFFPVHIEHGCHKQWNYAGFFKKQVVLLLKYSQETRFPRKLVESIFSVDPRQLSDPRKADHMTVVFRKGEAKQPSPRDRRFA